MWLSDFGSGTKYMTLCSCYKLNATNFAFSKNGNMI